jgi:hypothetical protein
LLRTPSNIINEEGQNMSYLSRKISLMHLMLAMVLAVSACDVVKGNAESAGKADNEGSLIVVTEDEVSRDGIFVQRGDRVEVRLAIEGGNHWQLARYSKSIPPENIAGTVKNEMAIFSFKINVMSGESVMRFDYLAEETVLRTVSFTLTVVSPLRTDSGITTDGGSTTEADATIEADATTGISPCSPNTCKGCCTGEGMCIEGISNEACGIMGSECLPCMASAVCITGVCVFEI